MTLPVPTEDVEQMAVIYYCKSKGYPVHHSNNEMYTTSWKQKRRSKELGTAKGFPDLIVLAHGKVIAIEMKRTKGSTTSPEQKWWIEQFNNNGAYAAICKGADTAIEFIETLEEL